MFKQISNWTNMFRHVQELSGRMEELQAKLQQMRVTGNSGGGMVTVEMTGTGEAIAITIDPVLINPDDTDMLQSLVLAAFNQATAKARQCYAEAMKDLAGGLPLPGLEEAFTKLMANNG